MCRCLRSRALERETMPPHEGECQDSGIMGLPLLLAGDGVSRYRQNIYRLGFMRYRYSPVGFLGCVYVGRRRNGVEAFVDNSPGEDLNGK